MTNFRRAASRTLALICLAGCCTFGIARAEQLPAPDSAVTRLEAENARLQRELQRAEAKFDALREQSRRPPVVTVIGGLGWIVGIFGTVAWLQSRKAARRGED